jgi:creatinine amidohydrolase
MPRRDSLLFGLALVAFVSLGLPDAVIGVAWPSMRRSFDLPIDRLGVLLFAASIGYLAASFLNGPVTRRHGVGGVLLGSSALVVLSAGAFAAAPRFELLLLAAVFAGTGGGAIDAAINGFAAARFSPGRVSWLHASYGVGAALGPMLMTAVLSAGLSWRWGYVVMGALIGILGVGFARTRAWWEAAPRAAAPAPHASLRDSLRRPVLHGSALLFFVYTGVETVAGQWAYSLFVEGRGMAVPLAGLAVSLYWGGLTLGRAASGIAAHRMDPRFILRGGLLLAPAWTVLLALGAGPWVDIAALGLLGFTVGPVFPLLIAETPGRVGDAHSANAVGVQIAAGSLGWAVLPAIAGVLAERLGLESVPLFLLGSALAVLLLHEALLKVPGTMPRVPEVTMPIRPALVLAAAAIALPTLAQAPQPPRTRDMARINWLEFRELVPGRIKTVLLPLGTLEPHGVTANGADILAPEAIARELAPRLDAMVAPTVPYGFTGTMDAYPGAFTVPAEPYRAYLREVLRGLATNRFRNIILINGHGGGQTAILQELIQEVGRETGARLMTANWWSTCSDVTHEVFGEDGGHAGDNETAFMQAIDPSSVLPERYSPDMASAYAPPNTWSAYPHPSSIGLYQAGQGYPKFDAAKAKLYFEKVNAKLEALIRDTIARWDRAGL